MTEPRIPAWRILLSGLLSALKSFGLGLAVVVGVLLSALKSFGRGLAVVVGVLFYLVGVLFCLTVLGPLILVVVPVGALAEEIWRRGQDAHNIFYQPFKRFFDETMGWLFVMALVGSLCFWGSLAESGHLDFLFQ